MSLMMASETIAMKQIRAPGGREPDRRRVHDSIRWWSQGPVKISGYSRHLERAEQRRLGSRRLSALEIALLRGTNHGFQSRVGLVN
jgi:hypothetical protein